MTPEIKDHIQSLRDQGFVIKLPGGTSRDGNIAAFGALVKKRYTAYPENKFIGYKLLVIPYLLEEYRSSVPIILDREKVFSEVKEQVLEREIIEETHISLAKGIYTQIAHNRFPDKRLGHEDMEHIQYLFLATHFDDSNRRRTKSPSEKNIGIPFWLNITVDLEEYIDSSHRWMIEPIRNSLGIRSASYVTAKKVNPALENS